MSSDYGFNYVHLVCQVKDYLLEIGFDYALLTLTEDGVSLFFMCAIVFFLESKFEKKNG
jgi:hypothetical protein